MPVSDSNDPKDVPNFPPEASRSLVKISRLARKPLERFLKIEASSGILLLVAAGLALFWANSPWAASYENLWNLPLGIRAGDFQFERSLQWMVNDILMVIFFFVVGLEIRREIHEGELSELRRAALPLIAALGGMIVPALLYLLLAGAPPTQSGWGVPMATDIAFAVGILALLGKRVPAALRVLLLALAVIDDLGAILVIALFYSKGISFSGFLIASMGFLGLFAMQRLGIRSKLAYIFPSLLAWAGIYSAGVHPTIAGVVVGLLTPVTAWLGPIGFLNNIHADLKTLERSGDNPMAKEKIASALKHFQTESREVLSPAESLIETLHPWVAYLIMPIFALANAGVSLSGIALEPNSIMVVAGVSLGLLFGKPIGILLFSLVAVKLRLALLPIGIGIKHLVVLGVVAGVGFTMALFIAQLAFIDLNLLEASKIGVLAGSLLAAIIALILGRTLLSTHAIPGAALTADEAEKSTLA